MSSAVYAITFDCRNADTLADFWAQAMGRTIDADATDGFASIGLNGDEPGLPRLMFVKVPEGKAAKNRVHLDLISADLDTEVRRLVCIGARQGAEFNEGGARWITLTDPEDNEFDILADQR